MNRTPWHGNQIQAGLMLVQDLSDSGHSVVVQVHLGVGAEEVEGEQTESDGVRGRWKGGGARKERRKRQKRKEGRSYHDSFNLLSGLSGVRVGA